MRGLERIPTTFNKHGLHYLFIFDPWISPSHLMLGANNFGRPVNFPPVMAKTNLLKIPLHAFSSEEFHHTPTSMYGRHISQEFHLPSLIYI